MVNNDGENFEVFNLYSDGTKENHREVSKYPGTKYGSIFGGRFGTKTIFGNDKELYEYNLNEDKWVRIQSKEDVQMSGWDSKGCFIQDTYLLCGGLLGNSVELLKFDCISSNNSSSAVSLNQDVFCTTTLPFQNIRHHTITNIGHNKIILAGGYYDFQSPSNRVFQIELTEDKNDITLKDLEQMTNRRGSHVAFKMENYLYVAGGYNGNRDMLDICERYDIKKNKWFRSQHALPQALVDAHSAISADESFVVITGGRDVYEYNTDGIIIFTEQNGFQQFANVTMKFQRSGHVSMGIKK